MRYVGFGIAVMVLLAVIPASVQAGVKIESPADGVTVGGAISIVVSYTGTASYPVYYLSCNPGGGTYIDPPVLSGSKSFNFDTTYKNNGEAVVIAAYAAWAGDPLGASDNITVYVYNPLPVIELTSISEGDYISPETTTLPITVNFHNVAPNYRGIYYITYYTSWNASGSKYLYDLPASGTHTWNVNIASLAIGNHWIMVHCYDELYKSSEFVFVNFIRDNPPSEEDKTKQTPQEKQQTVGEPINVANGNMFTSATDIAIPAKGLLLELTRSYNSQDDFSGQFGAGWRTNFDITLTEQPDESILEVDEKGIHTIYRKNPDSTYTASAGKYSVMTKNPDATYTIQKKHGKKLYFDANGWLTRTEDRNNNYINVLRSSSGDILEASDFTGRKILFSHDASGKTMQVTDPANRIFGYEYDTAGNLVKVIDPLNNQTTYQYDEAHNLISQIDTNGNGLYFEYDEEYRAWHSWQDQGNNEVILNFDPVNYTTTTTDSLDNITVYEYNEYGLVTKITDAENNTQEFTWDTSLNRTSATDKNANTTTFTYDTRGNLLSIKDPLNNTTWFTYEPLFDFAGSITNALGNITEYTYDPNGNMLSIEDSLHNFTWYLYDTTGQIIQIKDANDNPTDFAYNSYGNIIQITDSLNNVTHFEYDILGNLTRILDPRGNPTDFAYDLLNRLIKITHTDNSEINYEYDKVGNLRSYIDQENNVTTYAYDMANRLSVITDALSNKTSCTYDTEGNRLSIVDANTNTTEYQYNSLNRLIKTIMPRLEETVFNYDANGNIIAKTDANNNTINYTYDKNNRLIKITYPDTSEVIFNYDALGRRTTMADTSGVTAYGYDAVNRLIEVNGPGANDTITYNYDKAGNRTQLLTPFSNTSYNYDELNRLIKITNAGEVIAAYNYDEASNLTQIIYPNNTQASYVFDNLNRIISLTNKNSSAVISSYDYEHNKQGMRTKMTLSNNTYLDYNYDALSRLTSAASKSPLDNQLKFAWAYEYDKLGNRLTYIETEGNNLFDDFNRSNNLDAGTNWEETAGDWQIDNNRLFMPNAETDAIIIYSSQQIANPVIETTTYLETVGNKKGSYIIFSYQNANDFYYAGIEGISDLWVIGHYQNGAYNDLVTLNEPIEKLIDYKLKVSVQNNTVTLESLEDNIWTEKVAYCFNTLPPGKVGLSVEKSRTRFDDFKVSWQISQTTSYLYNKNNQLIESASSDETTSYVYDENGNLTTNPVTPAANGASGTWTYTYDYENRLIGADNGTDTTAIYTYDGFGRRIKKEVAVNSTLSTVNYVYDGNQVIAEYDGTGTLLRSYIYGMGIDKPILLEDRTQGTEDRYYYHFDGLGSVTELTDSSGNIIEKYEYDAFGNTIVKDALENVLSESAIGNPYGFTGRRMDNETGLYYYRARMYSPELGRFLQVDPVGYLPGLNLYTYVDNNPVNYVDPWGWCGEKINANVFRIRVLAGGGLGFFLGGEFITMEIEHVTTGKKQFYSYLGVGGSFSPIVVSSSGPTPWTEFITSNTGLTEQSFHGYVVIKAASIKVGGGIGIAVINWVTGPAAGEEVSTLLGFETGVALEASALHGGMWRR
ncbi:MAG: RHS repeat-associated core domain-containing protein [Candidatus Omnitrophota bacterium]